MRNMRVFVSAVVACVTLVSVNASFGELIKTFDFTNGGSAWTATVHDAGLPIAFEMGGNPTKVGYESSTAASGYATLWQEVKAPEGQTMSNLRLEAKVSGYSSWVMLGRIGLSTTPTDYTTQGTAWTGVDHLPSGVVYTDEPVAIDASSIESLNGISSVWVGAEVVKGLASVYQQTDVSEIRLSGDVVPEPATMGLMMCGGLLLGCLRKR